MDEAQIRNIASLAKLRIKDEEIGSMLKDFNKMLSYVDQIKSLDTDSVKEDEVYFQTMEFFREDQPSNGLTRDDLSKNAPAYENGYIVVPRVIET